MRNLYIFFVILIILSFVFKYQSVICFIPSRLDRQSSSLLLFITEMGYEIVNFMHPCVPLGWCPTKLMGSDGCSVITNTNILFLSAFELSETFSSLFSGFETQITLRNREPKSKQTKVTSGFNCTGSRLRFRFWFIRTSWLTNRNNSMMDEQTTVWLTNKRVWLTNSLINEKKQQSNYRTITRSGRTTSKGEK